jgi:hypothetical protein
MLAVSLLCLVQGDRPRGGKHVNDGIIVDEATSPL